ncbi:hypothetical protein ACN47E_004836 [Coniothyrium glycines]
MGWFSSPTEKPVSERYPNNPDITTQRGSGAEQDRYGQHFGASTEAIERGINKGVDKVKDLASTRGSGAEQDRYGEHLAIGDRGYNKLKGAAKDAARYKGDGAEQDRYAAHFSPALHNLDAQVVRRAAARIAAQGEKASYLGLGYDGQQRAKLLAGSGVGAEQERLGQHFGLTKEAVQAAAQRLKDGAKDVLERR